MAAAEVCAHNFDPSNNYNFMMWRRRRRRLWRFFFNVKNILTFNQFQAAVEVFFNNSLINLGLFAHPTKWCREKFLTHFTVLQKSKS